MVMTEMRSKKRSSGICSPSGSGPAWAALEEQQPPLSAGMTFRLRLAFFVAIVTTGLCLRHRDRIQDRANAARIGQDPGPISGKESPGPLLGDRTPQRASLA